MTVSLIESSVVALAAVDDQLGLGVAALAAEALHASYNVTARLVSDLAKDHVAAVQPEKILISKNTS